ncbi:MAG: hypothetical protein FWG79_09760, partial [Bacteroidales bacterium]|nr:hypothetical protein [Bacteroidales bacterium]
MISLKKISFIALYATLSLVAIGQTVCPTAPNFMNLHSPCVVATYGTTSNPFLHTGIVDGRHTLITTQGFDPRTGNNLRLIPEGETQSIKLGNEQIGSQAEAITYHFEVEPNKSLLSIKFAVVFQDPGHPQWEQPRFLLRILNDEDELVETCAEYDVAAMAEISGFETWRGMGTPIVWRDWTTVALDLSHYIGQNMKVQFITYDCGWSGHFGYAYFTAEILPNKLELSACKEDSVHLNAPLHLESYLWTNGDTTSSTFYVMQNNESLMASCLIKSVTGCEFTLNAYISDIPLTRDTTFFDTICEGEPYSKNYFDLPPQYRLGTSTHINSFYDANTCSGVATAYLNLMVRQRIQHIRDAICHGENYTKHGFNIIQPNIGTLHDTLIISDDDCDRIIYLTLMVNHSSQSLPENIFGNTEPCSGEVETYSIPNAEFFTTFNWSVPDDVNVIGSRTLAKISLQFTADAEDDYLELYIANGCTDGILRLFIEPKISHYLSFEDSICTGSTYNKDDFDIPRQDSAGFFIFSRNLITADGCDSVRSLFLYVFPLPEIEILSSANVICIDDSVQLHAVATSGFFDFSTRIKIGDIYCSDGSILDTADFKTSGKTAEGVVFWISLDETYCWIADLNQFRGAYRTVMSLPGVSWSWTNFDTAGYQNTLAFRNDNPPWHSVALQVDFDNGWFIPATTQMRTLFGVATFINKSLVLAGGTPFVFDGDYTNTYWTSSRVSNAAWTVEGNLAIVPGTLHETNLVRPIRHIELTKPQQKTSRKIGDSIHNSDGSVGIVFWINPEGTKGYMLDTRNYGNSSFQSRLGIISNLSEVSTFVEWLNDMNGYSNTFHIRNWEAYNFNFGNTCSSSAAACKADLDNGWFLPSAGILNLLYNAYPFIHQKMVEYGGNPLSGSRWSSTQVSEGHPGGYAVIMSSSGGLVSSSKNTSSGVCIVREFSMPASVNFDYDTTLTYLWSTGDTVTNFIAKPTADTLFTVTATSSVGCATTASRQIFISRNEPQEIFDTICIGYAYRQNGFDLPPDSNILVGDFTYQKTLHNDDCEIDITLHLTKKPSEETIIVDSFCDGKSYIHNGVIYASAGDYVQFLTSENGCDSVLNLNLSLKYGMTTTLSADVCEQYIWNNQ